MVVKFRRIREFLFLSDFEEFKVGKLAASPFSQGCYIDILKKTMRFKRLFNINISYLSDTLLSLPSLELLLYIYFHQPGPCTEARLGKPFWKYFLQIFTPWNQEIDPFISSISAFSCNCNHALHDSHIMLWNYVWLNLNTSPQ